MIPLETAFNEASEKSPLDLELESLASTRDSLTQSIAALEDRHDAKTPDRARTINGEKRALAEVKARIEELSKNKGEKKAPTK